MSRLVDLERAIVGENVLHGRAVFLWRALQFIAGRVFWDIRIDLFPGEPAVCTQHQNALSRAVGINHRRSLMLEPRRQVKRQPPPLALGLSRSAERGGMRPIEPSPGLRPMATGKGPAKRTPRRQWVQRDHPGGPAQFDPSSSRGPCAALLGFLQVARLDALYQPLGPAEQRTERPGDGLDDMPGQAALLQRPGVPCGGLPGP